MKKLLYWITLMIFSVGLISIPVIAGENIKVLLNDTELVLGVSPQLINDRTMVPIEIFGALGARVEWDDYNEMINVFPNDGCKIVMQVGNKVVSVGLGEKQKFTTYDVAPQILNNITFVPLRTACESMDLDVEWDEKTKTIKINPRHILKN